MAASRTIRSNLERELLDYWLDREQESDDWMIVDGALRGASRNVIGLVKSFTRQYVSGDQAGELFACPQGIARLRSWSKTNGGRVHTRSGIFDSGCHRTRSTP